MRRPCLAAALALALSTWGIGQTNAQVIAPISVTGSGSYTNAPSLITDNVIPAEGSIWTGATNVFWTGNGFAAANFTIDYGQIYNLVDLVLSLDNNDTYNIEYSTNNTTWTPLLIVSSGFGEIGSGMDTFSTVNGDPEYVAGIDFAPVQARYLRAYATAGDNSNSIGEIQSFGTLPGAAVPEPSAIAMFGIGAAGLLGRRLLSRRRK
jgi:hypothetical protein